MRIDRPGISNLGGRRDVVQKGYSSVSYPVLVKYACLKRERERERERERGGAGILSIEIKFVPQEWT